MASRGYLQPANAFCYVCIAPVPYGSELPIPIPTERDQLSSGERVKADSEEDAADPGCNCTEIAEMRKPYFPNQKDLNDLIIDLSLTKCNAELLMSRLKDWNLLDESVQVTEQRKRHERFSKFFSQLDGLCFGSNVTGLFAAIAIIFNLIDGANS